MRVRAPLTVLAAIPLALAALSGCGSAAGEERTTAGGSAGDGAFPVTIEHTFGETTVVGRGVPGPRSRAPRITSVPCRSIVTGPVPRMPAS